MATESPAEADSKDDAEPAVPCFDTGLPPSQSERAIPIRTADLIRLVQSDPALGPADRAQMGRLARMLGAVFHYEYFQWLVELKDLYAPLDPDSDCAQIRGASKDLTDRSDEDFLRPFEATLVRANYRALDFRSLEEAIAAPNEMGLSYVPNFSLFEHLRVYVRGETSIERTVRSLRTRFRRVTLKHDGYRRMIVVLKFKPGVDLGEYVKGDVLYLRMYKDVPKVDIEMHLPEQGTKVRMRLLDKAQIASPLAIGLPTFALKLAGLAAFAGLGPVGIATLMAMPVSAGVKSFFGFQRAKQNHLARMVRHLYYLTLANNASVINRLVDSAEEEELKEALLGYHFLRLSADDPDACHEAQLDARVEAYLREKTGLAVDFEVGDALAKLVRLGLVQKDGRGRLFALPIDRALVVLDEQWDAYFSYPRPVEPGTREEPDSPG